MVFSPVIDKALAHDPPASRRFPSRGWPYDSRPVAGAYWHNERLGRRLFYADADGLLGLVLSLSRKGLGMKIIGAIGYSLIIIGLAMTFLALLAACPHNG